MGVQFLGSTINTYMGTAGPLQSWTTKGEVRPEPKLLHDMHELVNDWCGAG